MAYGGQRLVVTNELSLPELVNRFSSEHKAHRWFESLKVTLGVSRALRYAGFGNYTPDLTPLSARVRTVLRRKVADR